MFVNRSMLDGRRIRNPRYSKPQFGVAEEVIGEIVIPPGRKLEDLIRLSELCVDLLRGNEEFYAEVSADNK